MLALTQSQHCLLFSCLSRLIFLQNAGTSGYYRFFFFIIFSCPLTVANNFELFLSHHWVYVIVFLQHV